MSFEPGAYTQRRYLLAKRTVDDRALNRGVLEGLRQNLASEAARPRIVEFGAGLGTMVTRLVDWGLLERADYLLLDQDASTLQAARAQLEGWAGASSHGDGTLRVKRARTDLTLAFEVADALEFAAAESNRQRADLVFANAVLDLLDLETALARVFSCLKPEGIFWFSINFDGETIFVPEDPLDSTIVALYHQTMQPPLRSGSSQTGRRLLEVIPRHGATLLSAGSSDWVVFPGQNGYGGDEAYFLHHILHTIEQALRDAPDLDGARFARWLEMRHRQIEAGSLSYVAHQLDVLGRAPGA